MLNTMLSPPHRTLGRFLCWLTGTHLWCKACRVEAKFHCLRCGRIDQLTLDSGEPL